MMKIKFPKRKLSNLRENKDKLMKVNGAKMEEVQRIKHLLQRYALSLEVPNAYQTIEVNSS
jgi:hypothetical protein